MNYLIERIDQLKEFVVFGYRLYDLDIKIMKKLRTKTDNHPCLKIIYKFSVYPFHIFTAFNGIGLF